MIAPPTITTDRLVLAPPVAHDLDESAALWSDPIVTRYIGGAPVSRDAAWGRLLRYAGCWSLRGFGYWTVRERASGRHVGEMGFLDLRRPIEPSFEGEPEAGWALAPWCHGRGYATEALTAALAWAERSLDATRAVCMIDHENAPSLRLAERCGFVPWTDSTYKATPVRLMQRAFVQR